MMTSAEDHIAGGGLVDFGGFDAARDRSFSWDLDMDNGTLNIPEMVTPPSTVSKSRPASTKARRSLGAAGNENDVKKKRLNTLEFDTAFADLPASVCGVAGTRVGGRDRSLSMEILEQYTAGGKWRFTTERADSISESFAPYLLDHVDQIDDIVKSNNNGEEVDCGAPFARIDSLERNVMEVAPGAISPLQKSSSESAKCVKYEEGSSSDFSRYPDPSSFQSVVMSMPIPRNDGDRVGAYTKEQRRILIANFRAKRQRRVWRKQIKYDCRKKLADTRPRVKGRFVSRDVDESSVPIATDEASTSS